LNRGGAVVFFRNEDKVDDNADEVGEEEVLPLFGVFVEDTDILVVELDGVVVVLSCLLFLEEERKEEDDVVLSFLLFLEEERKEEDDDDEDDVAESLLAKLTFLDDLDKGSPFSLAVASVTALVLLDLLFMAFGLVCFACLAGLGFFEVEDLFVFCEEDTVVLF
jgi:hypothetical protein